MNFDACAVLKLVAIEFEFDIPGYSVKCRSVHLFSLFTNDKRSPSSHGSWDNLTYALSVVSSSDCMVQQEVQVGKGGAGAAGGSGRKVRGWESKSGEANAVWKLSHQAKGRCVTRVVCIELR